jgi:hypothetical protein
MLVSDESSQDDRQDGQSAAFREKVESMVMASRNPATRTSYRDEDVGVNEGRKPMPVLLRHALRRSLLLSTGSRLSMCLL